MPGPWQDPVEITMKVKAYADGRYVIEKISGPDNVTQAALRAEGASGAFDDLARVAGGAMSADYNTGMGDPRTAKNKRQVTWSWAQAPGRKFISQFTPDSPEGDDWGSGGLGEDVLALGARFVGYGAHGEPVNPKYSLYAAEESLSQNPSAPAYMLPDGVDIDDVQFDTSGRNTFTFTDAYLTGFDARDRVTGSGAYEFIRGFVHQHNTGDHLYDPDEPFNPDITETTYFWPGLNGYYWWSIDGWDDQPYPLSSRTLGPITPEFRSMETAEFSGHIDIPVEWLNRMVTASGPVGNLSFAALHMENLIDPPPPPGEYDPPGQPLDELDPPFVEGGLVTMIEGYFTYHGLPWRYRDGRIVQPSIQRVWHRGDRGRIGPSRTNQSSARVIGGHR